MWNYHSIKGREIEVGRGLWWIIRITFSSYLLYNLLSNLHLSLLFSQSSFSNVQSLFLITLFHSFLHWLLRSYQKQVKKCCSLKLDKILSIEIKCWSSTEAVFVENYKIRNSRSDYTHIPMYLCRVSFLTTLDIYKNYFKGHRTWNYIPECFVWPKAKIALVHHSLYRSYCVFTPRVL